MEIVLIVLVLAVMAFVGYRLYKKSQAVKQPADTSEPLHVPFDKPLDFTDGGMDPSHDLMRTEPGDMLSYDMGLESFNKLVTGVLTCKQNGSPAWLAILLDDGNWLSIEPGANAECARWKELPRDEVKFPGGGDLELVYGGVTYRRNDFGHATYTSAGETGLRKEGTLEFGEYRSPESPTGDHQYISFEQYDDNDFTLSVGESLMASALTRFPKGESSL